MNGDTKIRENIIHTLRVWPMVSPSMLHISIGSSLPTDVWKPILDELIQSEIIQKSSIEVMGPNGRTRNCVRLSLVNSNLVL